MDFGISNCLEFDGSRVRWVSTGAITETLGLEKGRVLVDWDFFFLNLGWID